MPCAISITSAAGEDLYDDLWEEMSQMYAACLALLDVGTSRYTEIVGLAQASSAPAKTEPEVGT